MSWVDCLSLLQGMGVTIAISFLAIAIGAPLGLCLALIRWRAVRGLDPLVAGLVSLLRAVPSVTLALLLYFALPGVGLSLSPIEAAVATLALGTMAFNCEIWRGALLAFPQDQFDAALAFGMRRWTRFRLIVLPQIFHASLPALTNEMTLLVKVSPAVAVIGVVDGTRAAVRISARTYQPLPPFLADLVLYMVVVATFIALQRGLERRRRGLVPA